MSDTSIVGKLFVAPNIGASHFDVSVVFATFRRPEILERTLEAFSSLAIDPYQWQLIIVDNADDPETQKVLRRFQNRLPLTWLVEPLPGKNRALNAALPLLQGDLYVFTDDDVLPESRWLEELLKGSRRWPGHSILGGSIVPDRPIPFDASEPFVRSAYVISESYEVDTEIPAGRIWGPNMAIRAETFRADGRAFDESIGPTAANNYTMGSETELLLRLEALGNRAMFIPTAVVQHQIRPEQLSLDWLRARCFRAGRGLARRNPVSRDRTWFGVPRYLARTVLICWFNRLVARLFRGQEIYAKTSMEYSFVVGQIAEYRSSVGR